jgi:hypothetical protein
VVDTTGDIGFHPLVSQQYAASTAMSWVDEMTTDAVAVTTWSSTTSAAQESR